MAKKAQKKQDSFLPLPLLHGTPQQQLEELYEQWFGCTRCGLAQQRTTPDLVFGSGNADADILLLGEGPGGEEEDTGVPFVGPSGQLLNQLLARVSDHPDVQKLSEWFDTCPRNPTNVSHFHKEIHEWRDRAFFITNVVACRPPENRTPSNPEVKACYERVRAMIYTVDPMLIIAVGKSAAEVLAHKTVEITRMRGQLFEVEIQGRIGKVTYPVLPILHPAYLLRKADWKTEGGSFELTQKDLMRAMRLVDAQRQQHFDAPIPKRLEMEI